MKQLLIDSIKCIAQNNLIRIMPINNILKEAVQEQNAIGWFQFIEGFWSTKWRQCITQHLNLSKSMKSPLLLLSKTQRRIWMIAWNMWMNRNTTLHKAKKSIHPNDITSLHKEIEYELSLGSDTLPTTYHHLFNFTPDDMKAKPNDIKLIWLYSVWSTRELIDDNYLNN